MEKHHAMWWAILVVAGLFTGLYGIELLELREGTQLQLSSGSNSLTGFAVAGEESLLTGMAAVDLSDEEQTLDFGKGGKESLSWDTGEENYGLQEFNIKLVSVSGPTRATISVGEKETVGKNYVIQSNIPLKLNLYGDETEDLMITLASADKTKGTAKIKAAWLNPLGGAAAKDDVKTIPQIPGKLPILPPKKDSAAGGACPVSLSNYDVNKDGGVDADDLTELNAQLGSPLIAVESCPAKEECPAGEEGAVPTPVVPECSSLADCKSKEACNKKQLASGKLCIWSPVGAEKTVSDKRKGECNSLTACINYEGKCHEPDVFYTAKHICGEENTWAVCDATIKGKTSYPLGKYTCDGKTWKETKTSAGTPAPKVNNAPIVQSLLSSFLGKTITAKEGEKYTGYVLAQDPDGISDVITKFEIPAVSKDGKKLDKNPFVIDAKGKLEGSWTKSSVTWEKPMAGTYGLVIKVTSKAKDAKEKSTTITDTITVKGKPAATVSVPSGAKPSVGKLPAVTFCNTLADCKKNEKCKGKQEGTDKAGDPEYCVWSKADGKQTDTRKRLCPSNKMCTDASGKCYNSGDLNLDNKYVCDYIGKDEPTGQNNWVKCDKKDKKYGVKYTCDGTKWVETKTPAGAPAPIKSLSSIVKVDLGKEATKGWLHIGDTQINYFNDAAPTLPSKTNLKFSLPYTIGKNELFFKVNEVNNKKDKIKLDGTFLFDSGADSDEVILDLLKNINVGEGKNKQGVVKTTFSGDKKEHTLLFDIGVDDLEISEMYVKTGIISESSIFFGYNTNIKGAEKQEYTYTFNSDFTPKTNDMIQLRFWVMGMDPDVETKVWFNNKEVGKLNELLDGQKPTSYKEITDLSHKCKERQLLKSYTPITVSVDGTLLGKGKNNILVKTTKKDGDEFFIGRVEVLINPLFLPDSFKLPGSDLLVSDPSAHTGKFITISGGGC